ncbi:unnamed protein product [Rotaria sp. Silwood2]|nr:unnamed protein product [Rotaria sp. Silwood2]
MHSSTNSKLDKHDHHEYDRVSTIENSLNLIDDTPVTNGNTNDLHDNTFDNHIPNNCLPKVEQEDFSASNVTQGNTLMFDDLEVKLREGFDRLKIQNASELSERIHRTEQQINKYQQENKTREVERETRVLAELLELQTLAEKIGIPRALPVNEKEEECPITEESLRNMYKDFSSMPCCSERSVICLLYYISLNIIGNTFVLDYNIEIPDRIEREIQNEFEILEKRLKIEELGTKEIQHLVDVSFINVKRESWKSALVPLKQLLKQINSLNMQEMFRLVEKVNDAAQLIKNKNIILFLGGTGSGKSTIIHFFGGSKMAEQEINGLNHIAPVEITNSDLKNVTTSPFARSETRYITPVTVNIEDVGGNHSDSIILCDTPGFDDTSGVEVDIANRIGIVKAIKGCKRVKPVVLISYKSIGDRLEGLKNLAHILGRLIPGIRDQMNAFSYIFTKYPQDQRNKINPSLCDVKKNMNNEEKSDSSFINFVHDMVNKTKRGALVIDPINDAPGQFLDDLVESSFIQYPEEVFQFFISQKSKSILQEQVRKHQLSIISATKRSEYSFIKYKLDQLKHLNELLDQDYIEQIYKDCVQYISRHLSEEYEEGISTLNRCLMYQIVLNNEDIKQYQIRIDHAKLAEEVIGEHLGKEVIHSSAFIQYMDKQVDIMLEDLQEKDINDSSVKITLDKIKLLSKYFPVIHYKYKNVCQVLSRKFENVVDFFKSSVLSNNFDNSANEITKVYEALTVLQDHLDNQNMETKYIQLKEYFLKYLKDSVEKLNDIINQEKLDESDVERINSCVSMLESVNNTYTLRSHISKEAVSEVHENFLSKILKHFEDTIEKIKTQMQKENSFHTLEQLVKEMDLIRTISVIKSKTNPSYYSILERLIGYVQEARRDIEEILKTLFQREGKINYNKLPKCLSNLKDAKWIEAYRPGVYVDVIHDVEEQIIQYVEELHKSILDVNLDLDNFDKIEYIYKKILEINEIKRVQGVIENVRQYIDEVNAWFEGATNNVFSIIKNTFISKKWTEKEYQTLDFDKAEKAFCYLNACKTIRILFKSQCTSIFNDLVNVIKEYSKFIHEDNEKCFESIKDYQCQDNKVLFNKARIFLNNLREISEIKMKYPHVFSCFANVKIIEYWQNELANYLHDLSDEMAELKRKQQTEALSIKLSIVKALSKLDSFSLDEKYNDLHQKYQDVFLSQTTDACRQVMDAIKNGDYERVALEMSALQAANGVEGNFLKQAKRELRKSVEHLLNKTKDEAMRGESIQIEGIKSVVENLKQIECAKRFIHEYLSTPDEIGECILEVKKIIGDWIKRFIDNIKALITIYNFSEANQKMDSLLSMHMLLKKCSPDDVSSQIEAVKQFEKDVVLNIVDKYSKIDISGFMLNPPKDIFEKLDIVKDIKPIFKEALNTISDTILTKFRDEFKKTQTKMMLDPENIRVKKIESTFVYLPKTMKETLETELNYLKDDITLLIQDHNQKLDDVFDTGNLTHIKDILEEYQNSEGMQSFVNKGRVLASNQVQDMVIKINEDCRKNNIREALINAKKLYDYKKELENIFSEIKQPYFEIEILIKTTCQNAYLSFINQFKNINISVTTNEITENMEKTFMCLMEFMKGRGRIRP